MPSYDYQCPQCEWETTEIRSIHEDQKTTHCPNEDCTAPLRRVYNNIPPVIFKADGFYSRDQKLQVTYDGQDI